MDGNGQTEQDGVRVEQRSEGGGGLRACWRETGITCVKWGVNECIEGDGEVSAQGI